MRASLFSCISAINAISAVIAAVNPYGTEGNKIF